MTTEKLKNTIKLAEGIEALETFQNAFREPYVKGLFAYKAGAVEPIRLSVESDSELY